MKLIGIGGTNGSGKDTVGHILAQHYGFVFISLTDMLRAELTRRGLPHIRENTRALSTEWRSQYGLAVLVDKVLEAYTQSGSTADLATASLRNPGEVDRVHELGGRVLWIDGDPQVRYARVEARARGPEDHKTFEEFMAEERAEMEPSGGDTGLHGAAVKAQADIFITNDSDSLDKLTADIARALHLA